MKIIDAEQMRSHANFPDLVDALHAAHLKPTEALDDMLLSQPGENGVTDSILVRAAWQRQAALGAKLATIFPNNAGSELPSVQAAYVLFDGKDGHLTALLDGTELTYWKTAADSALGARLLGPTKPEQLLMVGAGALAPYLIRAHCAVAPSIRRVRIWNRTASKAEALAQQLATKNLDIQSVNELQPAVLNADVISCATMTRDPLIHGAWLRSGQHLDLVGAFTPTTREADDGAVKRARVFVDCFETTLEDVGDIVLPLASGALSRERIEGDLYTLCRDGLKPARAAQDITLFKNGGGGHLDLMTAQYFLAQWVAV